MCNTDSRSSSYTREKRLDALVHTNVVLKRQRDKFECRRYFVRLLGESVMTSLVKTCSADYA